MRRSWHWLVLVFALWAGAPPLAWAQDSALPSGSASGSSSSSGSSSGSGSSTDTGSTRSGSLLDLGSGPFPSLPVPSTGTTPSSSSSFGLPSSTTPPAASSFGLPTPDTTTPRTPVIPGATRPGPFAPPTSTYGTAPGTTGTGTGTGTTTPTTPTEPPTSFTIPGNYGALPQTFTVGQGRLARPRYRYTGSLSIGLDDNVLSASFKDKGVPAVTQEVEVAPARPEQRYVVIIPPPGRPQFFGPRPERRVVIIPAQPAKFETEVLSPAIPPQDRIASIVARANVGFETQFATKKTVFTMNVNASASVYSNRPGDQTDLNGSFTLAYLHRITPRLQFSATANLAYLSQPDISRVNTPTQNVGDYFNGAVRANLTYRFTKRLSSTTSLSLNSTLFNSASQEVNNFYEVLLGEEIRYLYSPRMSLLGEARYGITTYPMDQTRDSHSVFVLGGSEFTLTRQIGGSIRLGVELRTFDESGESKVGPYAETSLAWRYHAAGVLSWTTHFGFEEPPNAATTVQAFRTSIQLAQAFSARLRATASASVAYTVSEFEDINTTNSDNSFSLDAGMEYSWNRHLTLTASYSFSGTLSNVDASNYLRNQIFFGIQYAY